LTGKTATIALRAKLPSVSSPNPKLLLEYSANYNANNAFALIFNEGTVGTLECAMHSPGGTSVIQTTNRYDDNARHHITCVVDRNAGTTTAQAKIYIDGQLVESQVYNDNATVHTTPFENHPLSIGARQGGIAAFNNALDEVRIINRPMNAAEVAVLYQTNIAKYASDKRRTTTAISDMSDGPQSFGYSIQDLVNFATGATRDIIKRTYISSSGHTHLTTNGVSAGTTLDLRYKKIWLYGNATAVTRHVLTLSGITQLIAS